MRLSRTAASSLLLWTRAVVQEIIARNPTECALGVLGGGGDLLPLRQEVTAYQPAIAQGQMFEGPRSDKRGPPDQIKAKVLDFPAMGGAGIACLETRRLGDANG
jgi:hypothetical protein